MAVKEILQLGNPLLYQKCSEITEAELGLAIQTSNDLHDTMEKFREMYGRGRAISAPQIGVMKRLIYMNIEKPLIIINPTLCEFSDETIELWDDCMSFPDLVVKIRRHKFCTLKYLDENLNCQTLQLENDLSELIQHEYDHLDGILAIQRAIDSKSIAYRNQIFKDNQ